MKCFKNIPCCGCAESEKCTAEKVTDATIAETIDRLFRRYGSPSDDASIEIREYLRKPETIAERDRIAYYDKSAAETIETLEKTIEDLKIYRLALQKAYAENEIAPKKEVIKLTRRKDSYANKIFYYLSIYEKNMNTGAEVLKETKKYAGKERNQAIKEFEDYKKNHYGIIAEKDIERRF